MNRNTGNNLLEYLKTHQQATGKELADYLGISRQALFKHLNKLLATEQIYKVGKPPKVFYLLKTERKTRSQNLIIDKNIKNTIDDRFMIITPAGQRLEGWSAFQYWCDKTNQKVPKTAIEYIKTIQKYDIYKKEGLIDGMTKLRSTFSNVSLDKLYYLDFYNIERFGKTKLGQMLLYAKQSQNKVLIKELVLSIKPQIEKLIHIYRIEAIGFIPPTVKREIQFMKELEKYLNSVLPSLNIVKIKTEIAVPQKTLSKLEDRVENARRTIIVEEKRVYNNILLIDDAVGSGSTLNETAAQLKRQSEKSVIIGLAITGSFKGFDVISEV